MIEFIRKLFNILSVSLYQFCLTRLEWGLGPRGQKVHQVVAKTLVRLNGRIIKETFYRDEEIADYTTSGIENRKLRSIKELENEEEKGD